MINIAEDYGLNDRWIYHMLTHTQYRLLYALNWSEPFAPRCGTTQGDVLSILLFGCAADKWCRYSYSLPKGLTHFNGQYVDDGVSIHRNDHARQMYNVWQQQFWAKYEMTVDKYRVIANQKFNETQGTAHPHSMRVLGACIHLNSTTTCDHANETLKKVATRAYRVIGMHLSEVFKAHLLQTYVLPIITYFPTACLFRRSEETQTTFNQIVSRGLTNRGDIKGIRSAYHVPIQRGGLASVQRH
jgi:hypothetical protein